MSRFVRILDASLREHYLERTAVLHVARAHTNWRQLPRLEIVYMATRSDQHMLREALEFAPQSITLTFPDVKRREACYDRLAAICAQNAEDV